MTGLYVKQWVLRDDVRHQLSRNGELQAQLRETERDLLILAEAHLLVPTSAVASWTRRGASCLVTSSGALRGTWYRLARGCRPQRLD